MSNGKTEKYFSKNISNKQAADAGMAIVLLLLLVGVVTKNMVYFKITIPVLIVNMTIPKFYYPFAIVWFGFSNLLGSLVSKILLTIIYIILVFPMGMFRKLIAKDSLQLSGFRKSNKSVMNIRDHVFTAKDLENPY